MNTNGSFGAWLKQRRKALDLTQAELADQVGCTVTTIQKIEANLRRPSKQIAERLIDVLAISPDEQTTFVSFARRMSDHLSPPPSHSISVIPASNLPTQSTPFLGRETELAEIANRLADPNCRLLTLVGVGGIGKTRLALQAAAERVEDFADGVYFVALAPVGLSTLIAAAIANVLELSFYGQEDPNIQVVNYLHGKHMLLVMDNYEHLLPEIALLNDLLVNAPRLKILVTSRERLNLHEEWVLQVEGLLFPSQLTNDEINSYSAIRLFMQTASRSQPNFSLEGNQNSVIDICQAVEGMPLGIELAATWLRAMPCHQIADQIRHNLDFLATPLRNIPDRHRSLRSVFEYSWSLLSDTERNMLMKLSVFRGGIHPEAAEHVAQAPLWLLASLVDKSLVRLNAAGRYDMHELLRQFAADKLLEVGTTAATEQHHFQYFLGVAEQLNQRFFGPQHIDWMDRLETELDNFRAALDWAFRVGDAESGLRMAGALGWFWNRRAYWKEGLNWLKKFSEASGNVPASVRALALHHTLELSIELGLGQLEAGQHIVVLFNEGLRLVREVQDPWHKAWLLNSLGFAGIYVPYYPTGEYHLQALELFTKLGDKWGICETLSRLAFDLFQQGDFAPADEWQQKGIDLARQENDKSVLSWLLLMSGYNHWFSRRIDQQTENLFRDSLTLFRELRYKNGAVGALLHLGKLACLRHEIEQATDLLKEGLKLIQQIGGGDYDIWCLTNLAEIFCISGKPERGARLLGMVGRVIEVVFPGNRLFEVEGRIDFERALAAAHVQLDEATFATDFAEGQKMSLDQAVAYALEDDVVIEMAQPMHKSAQALVEPLSVRECEVLRLVAEGCSNQEIADRLFIGVSTVKKHINHIYDKLDTKNRTQAIAHARDLKLLN